MEQSMKVFGRTIFTTAEASFIMLVEISMKVNLLTIWLKALEFTNMLMVASMSATGTKINSTDLVKKNGMTWVCIKDSIRMHLKKDRVNTVGLMATATLESGVRTCWMVRDFSYGTTIDSILETGRIIWCTVKVFTNGVMVEYLWEPILMTEKVEWVATYGLTEEPITVNG
jgi:hypothetical protein